MIKDSAPTQAGLNQPPLTGESSQSHSAAPPPAYTPNPIYQGLPLPAPSSSEREALWTPPANEAEANSRARARLLKAYLLGWAIYLFTVALFGGGMSDSYESGHDVPARHRHRSGKPVVTLAAVAGAPPATSSTAVGQTEVVWQGVADQVLGEEGMGEEWVVLVSQEEVAETTVDDAQVETRYE